MDKPEDISALLDNSIADLDETYKKYEAVCTERATHEFICDSYEHLDATYKELVFELSQAYLSGSNWYIDDKFPMFLFDLILMVGLVRNASSYAIQRGCRDSRLNKCVVASFEMEIDLVD